MLRRIVVYGLIAGVIVAIPTSLLPVLLKGFPPQSYGMVVGYASMLIAFSTIFLAIKRQRDVAGGGVIGFFPALALGLGISIVAGIIYVLAWELAMAATHMDFAGDYARAIIAHAKAKGVTGPALAKLVAEMAQFKRDYANPLYRFAMTFVEIFPVGVLVSVISAALLRNSRFLPARR
ncbi:MAG TPA: DUF4199 domain-containing protein [Rhizomicrobium sp.]